ncbi:DHA2 family efflux MFS transporter permease subunit [Pseudomonas aeruginosa]|uniref:DHA2 family efflux MFS transporter permease subunit n=1 Tax=Pseudomonas aeruginosa TaxID=287 RepID=UPI003D9C0059
MSENSSFSPPSLVMATIGLSLATFMQVLDTTIANVALPTISGNLGVSSEQGTWVITSFAVSNAIALPLTGWLARRVGEVRLFIAAALLFVLASFLCGIAQSMPSLVGFRALQGFVAGPLYPITQTLLISIYPPAKRGMALALLAMVTVVAPIAGPILGGWITDDYSWPWIFFINVPVGLFAAFVVYQQLKARPVTIKKAPMDYVGLIALVIGVGALQIVLDKGNDLDWFESDFIVGGALIAAIALAFFIIWEFTDRHPIVNLRLFAHRNFAASLTTWIWNRRATQHHAYLSENISLYDPATHETLAQLGGNTQTNAALLDRMVQSQAYMMSTIDYFTMLGWLFLALLVIIWLARPPFGAKPGAAASGH